MSIAIGIWSCEVAGGDAVEINPPADVRITNVALGDELADESGRGSIKLVYRLPGAGEGSDDEDNGEDDENVKDADEIETTVLCSLTAGKIEQVTVDVVLEGESEYVIENTGKNTVYLTGNYIDQNPNSDMPPFDDSDDEDDYDLRDVSSDVEVNADDLDDLEDDSGRFEEITEAPSAKPTNKKRARDSDAMESNAAAETKPSKADTKKQNKKLKAEDGKAAPAPTAKADEKKPVAEKKEKKEKADKKEKKPAVELEGGVKVQDSTVGAGKVAKKGNRVSMRYIGKLTNGKVFDSNTKGRPFSFQLGAGEVIKGWDVGVAGMQVGGERVLTCPPAMAYGKRGAPPDIPPNSTLVFEVKLLDVK